MQTAAELLRARTSVAEDGEATELLSVCSAACAQMLGTIENVLIKLGLSQLGAADAGAGSTLARATVEPAEAPAQVEMPFGVTTLELTSRLFQSILATTDVIFHSGDFLEDGGMALRYMSPNVQRVYGHTNMGHLDGQGNHLHPFFQVLHPAEVAFVKEGFTKARARQSATGDPAALVRLSIYRRFRLPDQSYIPVLSTGCVDSDHFYMMCHALTSQAHREDAMRCRLGATIRELREPATSMLAAASLLMAHPSIQSDSEAKFLLNAMHAAGSLLLGIVGNVASLQCIEAGDTQMNVAPFDPHGAINEVLFVCRLGCTGGDKAVWTDEDVPLPPLVKADKTFLSAGVQNILVNALKFQEGRGVTLSATFQPDEADADGGMLLVSVADKGCGMSAEQAERCFLAFEAASAQKGGGMGLGLFIGRTLARRAGGDLTVNTALGQGSTFTLRLPVRIVRDSPAPMLAEVPTPLKQSALKRRHSSTNNGTKGSAADTHTLTCLLADDHVLNLRLMRRLLEQSGFEVTTAASGDEAFEKMQAMADRLDIAIIDFQMPVSGPDCVRMWRAWEREQGRRLRLPVVCLTANVLEEERRECQLAGFDSFLTSAHPACASPSFCSKLTLTPLSCDPF